MAVPQDTASSPLEWLTALGAGTARALRESPEFLSLGLMLVLDRRPQEPSARGTFLQLRDAAFQRIAAVIAELRPDADDETVTVFATYAVAAADGFFLARQIQGDSVDLERLFAMHARILVDAIARHVPDVDPGTPPTD
ncbi:hypothetical protein [Micromonospora sp. WMMD710]|uniref:hypothetical protein n=1 Tax=Micromonospora sp. WMMD710 TaxID=3016085 RepID=UPI00241721F8|nr:hypothetical protein [Micromonospora sp. WMMD710]MDG4759040.1 hypothetical protein [Micromonospora sp. WMMD710]